MSSQTRNGEACFQGGAGADDENQMLVRGC
jgi:hypothetical protein